MNVVTVRINGVEYNLRGEEREEYLHKVANYVDRKLKSIMEGNGKLSGTSAAVLTAVNAVDDLFKCDLAYRELSEKIEAFEQREQDYHEKIDALEEQMTQLLKNNEELHEKIENDEHEEIIRKKDEDIENLKNNIETLKESSEKYLSDYNAYKAENKELKFQLQSARYKIIDLQNKLVENQINLVKVKKMNNPLINNGK